MQPHKTMRTYFVTETQLHKVSISCYSIVTTLVRRIMWFGPSQEGPEDCFIDLTAYSFFRFWSALYQLHEKWVVCKYTRAELGIKQERWASFSRLFKGERPYATPAALGMKVYEIKRAQGRV